ncbi:hypothetical protein BG262_03570 [Floricoccus penangensis]|uniref:ABC-2 type transporter domain-containing protein n=1 Tax=Floricoccus penangensis TaxID=1859475 RepID=A0A9Q5NZT3_9LACT|nr:hypothetical protein [Floricoccus penangensis]OFI46883.1 hypothetical protein BG262_03570 [Floricoccus penangensis]
MRAVLLKLIFYYKRNFFELLSVMIRIFISFFPILILSSLSKKAEIMPFIIVSFMIIAFVSDLVVGAVFIFYGDFISYKFIDYKLSKISISKYLLVTMLFRGFFSLISVIISSILWCKIFDINIHVISNRIYISMIIIPVLFIFIFSFIVFGVYLTYKTNRFSFVTFILNMVFIFCGFYSPVNFRNELLSKIFNINIFSFLITAIRSLFFESYIVVLNYTNVFLIISQILLLIYFSYKIINYLNINV